MYYYKDVRKTTNRLLQLAEDGVISWEEVARAALDRMSEDDVAEMMKANELEEKENEED